MKDISNRPITIEQYINAIEDYNNLVKKIISIEKETKYITLARKIRYVIYEILTDIIAINFLIQFLFGQSIFKIFRDIYSYILSLF